MAYQEFNKKTYRKNDHNVEFNKKIYWKDDPNVQLVTFVKDDISYGFVGELGQRIDDAKYNAFVLMKKVMSDLRSKGLITESTIKEENMTGDPANDRYPDRAKISVKPAFDKENKPVYYKQGANVGKQAINVRAEIAHGTSAVTMQLSGSGKAITNVIARKIIRGQSPEIYKDTDDVEKASIFKPMKEIYKAIKYEHIHPYGEKGNSDPVTSKLYNLSKALNVKFSAHKITVNEKDAKGNLTGNKKTVNNSYASVQTDDNFGSSLFVRTHDTPNLLLEITASRDSYFVKVVDFLRDENGNPKSSVMGKAYRKSIYTEADLVNENVPAEIGVEVSKALNLQSPMAELTRNLNDEFKACGDNISTTKDSGESVVKPRNFATFNNEKNNVTIGSRDGNKCVLRLEDAEGELRGAIIDYSIPFEIRRPQFINDISEIKDFGFSEIAQNILGSYTRGKDEPVIDEITEGIDDFGDFDDFEDFENGIEF